MIGVLFTILKIIGITLLILLAILLLVIVMVLFVPVKYGVSGAYKDTVQIKGRITFAFPLLMVQIGYDENLHYRVRIFGIPIRLKSKTDKPQKPKKEEKKYSGVNESLLSDDSLPDTQALVSPDKEIESDKDKEQYENKTENKTNLKDKSKNIFDKIKNIKNTISELKDKINYYIEVLNSEIGKKAISTCKERLLKVLKSICPKHGEIHITFGLEDPATMGKILGWHGILYAYIGNLIYLNPDFENKCFECDFSVKGKIRFGTILYQVLCVITDKNCKQLLSLLKGRK